MVRLKMWLAIALALLGIITAIGVSLGAVVEPREVIHTWTILALLVIPSAVALWYLGRRREPPRPWLFVWIAILPIGLGGIISSLGSRSSTGWLDADFGQAGLFLLISSQVASSLWAAASLRGSGHE